MAKRYISILGNIGAGKTAIAHLITSNISSCIGVFEDDVTNNPHLSEFISSPQAYTLHNQVYFIVTALEAYRKHQDPNITVQDFSILGCPIFAEALMLQGKMTLKEYQLYERLCVAIIEQMPAPSLYIIVKASTDTLMQRIRNRGRASEYNTSETYLATLQYLHDTKLIDYWIPKCLASYIIIDTDTMDIRDPNKAQSIIRMVEEVLYVS